MRRFKTSLKLFRTDDAGVGATEFALIAPILIALYLGGAEASIAISVYRKVGLASAMTGDALTQIVDPDEVAVRNVLALGRFVIKPYDAQELTVTATAVWIDNLGKGTIDCSMSTTAGQEALKLTPYDVPMRLASMRNRSVIVTTARYAYSPMGTLIWKEPFDMQRISYFNPRKNARYIWKGC